MTAVAAVTAVLGSLWLAATLSAQAAIDPNTPGLTSELALVDNNDLNSALTTLTPSETLLAQFKDQSKSCPAPLAWVTVSPTTVGQKGTYRLRSGSYYSPNFALSGGPVRVAIPFPSPYDTGRGFLSVLHTGGDITIALQPAWRIAANTASIDQEVKWVPQKRCAQPNG